MKLEEMEVSGTLLDGKVASGKQMTLRANNEG